MQWSPTEELIYYVSTGSDGLTMHSVKYAVVGGVLTPLAPETVFTLAEAERYNNRFDITADGERFLFVTDAETDATPVRREPTIVLNWAKELEAIVPSK